MIVSVIMPKTRWNLNCFTRCIARSKLCKPSTGSFSISRSVDDASDKRNNRWKSDVRYCLLVRRLFHHIESDALNFWNDNDAEPVFFSLRLRLEGERKEKGRKIKEDDTRDGFASPLFCRSNRARRAVAARLRAGDYFRGDARSINHRCTVNEPIISRRVMKSAPLLISSRQLVCHREQESRANGAPRR